jgi:hypothetical protein
MLRQADAESAVPILAPLDGAYAMETVIEPCLNPPEGGRRIEIITRMRKDARLYQPLEESSKNTRVGWPRKWGRRLPAPQNHRQWKAPWQKGRAYVYGRIRTFRCKRLHCCGSVSGPQQLMDAYVFDVPGYGKLWSTIPSAGDLSAAQVLAPTALHSFNSSTFTFLYHTLWPWS